MSDKDVLKPCPFCGKEVHLDKDIYGLYEVGCYNDDCKVQPFTDTSTIKREVIMAWNTRVNNYEIMYKKTAAHNRQLIDDIEKADSDYFKMKKNRDEWKDAFYKSVDEFKKLSEICDRLVTAREMLMEEVNDLKDTIKNMENDFDECRDALETAEDEVDSLENEIERCENIIMVLTKENKKLKEMVQLCGSY
jgi:chromosome segregation ATPase